MNNCTQSSARFDVTPEFVRSRGDLYALADIQHVRLRRPWLVLAGAACSGVLALAAVFWPELFDGEKVALIVACAASLLISSRIGRMKLSSVVLREGDGIIWGEHGELRHLKQAIEAELVAKRLRSAGVLRAAAAHDATLPDISASLSSEA